MLQQVEVLEPQICKPCTSTTELTLDDISLPSSLSLFNLFLSVSLSVALALHICCSTLLRSKNTWLRGVRGGGGAGGREGGGSS